MHLLIPAAGSGRRMGANQNKLLLPLLDRPVLAWTLAAAAQSTSISWIGLIGQRTDWPQFEAILANSKLDQPIQILEGGSTRQESVFRGLQYLHHHTQATHVLIHDGARCLATPNLFDRCSQALENVDGLIAAIPVKDTIKIVRSSESEGAGSTDTPQYLIQSTPDRSQLWAAQTPQGFALARLFEAHCQAEQQKWQVTDDAALFEKLEFPVYIIEGEETNLKLTTPFDLAIAETILTSRLRSS